MRWLRVITPTTPTLHAQMYSSKSNSFDFVDLEEDCLSSTDFVNFVDSSNYPQMTPPPSTTLAPSTLAPTSLFLRSNCSPVKNSRPVGLCIEIPGLGTLKFNPKGPKHEGRDSQVFRGQLELTTSANYADNTDSTVTVAVKVYKEQDTPAARKEIEIAQSVTKNRPDFLKFYYSGQINGEFSSIWEWIDGGSLDKMILKAPSDFIPRAIDSVARSIAFLHAKNIAHHDIKPQNFLVSSDFSRIVLIDFGDSKKCADQNVLLSTEEGIGLGTLAYTAPELLNRKIEAYNPFAADVYSFGVLLFFILNRGQILPFNALLPHRAVQMILNVQKGFFAGEYNPQSPANHPLFPLMTACLNVNPTARPSLPEILSTISTVYNQ